MVYHATLCTLNVHYGLSYFSYICHPDDDNQMVMVMMMIIRLCCRGGSEAPQEATMLQLSEELAYVHQAYALCQAMRDRLAASLVFMLLSLHAERKLCLVKTTICIKCNQPLLEVMWLPEPAHMLSTGINLLLVAFCISRMKQACMS